MPYTQKINEVAIQVLLALNTFAYLRVKDLQLYLRSLSEQGLRRSIAVLKEEGYVTHTVDHNRFHVIALTVRGCNLLKKEGYSAHATSRFLNQGNYAHRTIANEAVIYHSRDSLNKVWTEYQIQTGDHPVKYGFSKVPDYLVEHSELGFVWGEVERSKKNKDDFLHLLRWISTMFRCEKGALPEIADERYLFRVEFACTDVFEKRLVDVVGRDFADQWFFFKPLDVSQWS